MLACGAPSCLHDEHDSVSNDDENDRLDGDDEHRSQGATMSPSVGNNDEHRSQGAIMSP